MYTSDCDRDVGCVLLQKQYDGTTKRIGYLCKTLTDQARNFDTTNLKSVAVVWAVLLLRPYSAGYGLILEADHHALRCTVNFADAMRKLARCRLRLLEYDFEVVHEARVTYQAADALSKILNNWIGNMELGNKNPVTVVF